ncbi:hypothetical protein ACIQCR_16735 [Streptomyces sp. NPDC093249]|uniref:hypothetical protein n=1 Tax=unclassified Streptomyces TaxID=2593676 RepID=UPI00344C9DBB
MTLTSGERGIGVPLLAAGARLLLDREVTFCLGSQVAPGEAMERAVATVRRALPALLGAASASRTADEVVDVVRELVDIVARDRIGADILGRVTADEGHVTVSVGERRRQLPSPGSEPGLYLVNRHADEVGQYRGDEGGYIVWAAINVE